MIVVSIFIADAAAAAMREVAEARVLEGLGLEGDRYAAGAGTFSKTVGSGRHVTLFEEEVLQAVAREYRVELSAVQTRRNVVTRGVYLNHLVGRELQLGEVRLVGTRLCEPCDHLAELTGLPAIKTLRHRGGLRCDIVKGGVLRAGDRVTV